MEEFGRFVSRLDWLSENSTEQMKHLRVSKNVLSSQSVSLTSYHASVIADFLRCKLLENRTGFTFETVMSSPDKVEILERAKSLGYRTYLYYVSTEDPMINVSRVEYRTKTGGHSVPTEKILSRYMRSLNLLVDAVKKTDRAFIFDNSGADPRCFAEITDGKRIEFKTGSVPSWFQRHIVEKIGSGV